MRHFARSSIPPRLYGLLLFGLLLFGLLIGSQKSLSPEESDPLRTNRYKEFIISFNERIGVSTDTKQNRSFLLYGEKTERNESTYYRFLSLVGPILSVERNYEAEEGIRLYTDTRFQAIDITTGESARLSSYFPQSEILQALLNDKFIENRLKKKPESIKSLKDLTLALKDPCEINLGPEALSFFAFHHVRGNQVAVRLGLPPGCGEMIRATFTEIGIYLNIPEGQEE